MKDLIYKTLGTLLDECAQTNGDTEALVYPFRGLRYTYKQFNEVCNRAAKAFLSIGIKKGDHVAIWATNYPEWLITMFATAKIGAILVTVNTSYKVFELEYLLKQSDSTTLVMIDGFKDSNYVEILNKVCPELAESEKGKLESRRLPVLKNVIYINDRNAPAGMFSWEELMDNADDFISDEQLQIMSDSMNPHEVINMQYTSGTTGFPKGVMLTHYNILNNGFFIGECMRLTDKDRLCIPVPFFHCFGCVLAVMACVTHCSTMVPVEYYSPVTVMETVQREKCTALHGVPTMFIFILDHPDFDKYDFSTLRTGIMAGSTCPEERMRQAITKMNMTEITISYGQTELSPVCTMTTPDDSLEHRVVTVGKAMPHIEIKVVDPETNERLPVDTPGELCAKGYSMMKGYYKMEEATRDIIDEEGFLHTGDLATYDEEGYYKIVGRVRDMIIRGGENIYPREIEELLYTNNKVMDVACVGVPSKKLGEEVMAYVILKENEECTEDEIKEFVKENIARHKIPKYVSFVDSFPLTASGKIQKYKLREMAVKMLGLDSDKMVEN